MTSTIPAVLAALVTLGQATLPDWQVINGPLGSVTTTGGRLLMVGEGDVTGRRDLDSMSLGTTSEQYVVSMVANVDLPGTDQTAADSAAMAAYTALEAAVRLFPGGPTLGLSVVLQALPTGDFSLTRIADENGRHAAVRFTILVYAQTT